MSISTRVESEIYRTFILICLPDSSIELLLHCLKVYLQPLFSMSSKRRIGVSIASTEAARRQLMQPVQCWEKVWAVPENGPAHLKVYRWVKTEKVQVRTFGDACGLMLNFKPL